MGCKRVKVQAKTSVQMNMIVLSLLDCTRLHVTTE